MEINASMVKSLRDQTGAGMMDCKKALVENGGDLDKAVDFLRKKGLASANKKASRETKEGLIHSYIHAGGKIGVMVEVNCETDFVARNEDFQALVKDIAMHIAAANPEYIQRDEIPEDVIARERDVFSTQAKEAGKPENIIDKIVDGKLENFYKERCLLDQAFIKESSQSIKDLITANIAKIGENITVRRFARFELGR